MIQLNENLKNQVAVVTGGGGVLCGEMAKELGRQGVKVAILDLREESAKAVANEIVDAGGEAIGIACDVLNKESILEGKIGKRVALEDVNVVDDPTIGQGKKYNLPYLLNNQYVHEIFLLVNMHHLQLLLHHHSKYFYLYLEIE